MSGTTTINPTHRLDCTPAEASRAACLNGGTCYAWDTGTGTRGVGCSCTSDWTGDRCEYVYIDPEEYGLHQASAQTIGIAVGVTLAILAVIAALIAFFCIKRRKNLKQKVEILKPKEEKTFTEDLDCAPTSYEKTNASNLRVARPPNGQYHNTRDSVDKSFDTQQTSLTSSENGKSVPPDLLPYDFNRTKPLGSWSFEYGPHAHPPKVFCETSV